ncbi:hypothetical protein DERF_005066 [Dermatophagoides farinae]|uniref:Uncharacterized protein n=1 Tax=Dermatophagoides farinae TaxID=6954 RepID=A0A922I382_DERFA|nr:hypothetical protein DERF_005066 [Dermatophagoides farinae]
MGHWLICIVGYDFLVGDTAHGWRWNAGAVVINIGIGVAIGFDRFSVDGFFGGTHQYLMARSTGSLSQLGREEIAADVFEAMIMNERLDNDETNKNK